MKTARHLSAVIGQRMGRLPTHVRLSPQKRFLGERFDKEAGLSSLNACYDAPKLALFIQPDWFEVAKAGVGTNRYAYSHNDPVNKLDPGGNSLLSKVGDALKWMLKSESGNSSHNRTSGHSVINSVEAARSRGVADAWRMEQQLIRNNYRGTRNWSATEREILRKGEIPEGYVGDHITSVVADVTKAADHRNIQFLSVPEHKLRHGKHGGTRTPIHEDRQIDRTLGGRLPDLATKGARDWPERAARALDMVLNSNTYAIIDAFDPLSIASRVGQELGVGNYFDDTPWEVRCARDPDCT